jgi:hypothetical protein
MEDLKTIDLSGEIKKILDGLKEKEKKVLIERGGLTGQKPKTLKKVGEKLFLTRERIRQIEKRAFEKLTEKKVIQENLNPVFVALNQLLGKHGGVISDDKAILYLSKRIEQNEEPLFAHNVKFALRASGFTRIKKSPIVKPSWTSIKNLSWSLLDKVVLEFEKILKACNKITRTRDIINLFKREKIYRREYKRLDDSLLFGILHIGQHILKVENTDTWGLTSWPEINPKTIHNWTYYVVKKYGQPIHFTKIGQLVGKALGEKKFNLKTVHNVLISDKRFVLVGNGLYALKEWGYEPGTVCDVIKRILKKEKNPLTVSEITKRVLLERQVRINTVLVNLQNKDEFCRIDRATYALASKD